MKKLIIKKLFIAFVFTVFFSLLPMLSFASTGQPQAVFGIRIEFILFAFTLLGVTIFHHKTMHVVLIGLAAILLVKFIFDSEFSFSEHIIGSATHVGEWRTLVNLLGLLFGFAILAKYFEDSGIPQFLSNLLPNDWKGGFVLLLAIMIISSFLDNIAAAMIGGTIAIVVFKGKVHIGFLAAIIAASNAGGAGSVVGDTTTTLMWIDGVRPLHVTHAYVASIVAIFLFGIIASVQQHKYQPILKDAIGDIKIDYLKLLIVLMILVGAIVTNWVLEMPAAGVWMAILIGGFIRKTP